MEITNVALVDCTSGPTIVDAYPAFIEANLHIITPNKWANALPWRRYSTLMGMLERRKRHFLFEANVGAGLPIVSTLRDLIASGDEIVRIEGILSGTLSYLFNTFDGSVPFSALVRDAHRMGFTEPDPREDLSGQDVARKLLILGRQIGLKMGSRRTSRSCAWKLHEPWSALHDAAMSRRLQRARSHGAVLRYVGTLERGKARAGLKEYPRNHPIASAKGSDNVIAFTTKRYRAHAARGAGPRRRRRRHRDGCLLGHPEAAALSAALSRDDHASVASGFPPPLRPVDGGATARPSRSAKREGWQPD